MIQLTLEAIGLPAQLELVRLQRKYFADLGPSLQRAAYPWLLAHIKRQIATSGAHGGKPWTFGGEAKYAASKAARYGKRWGARPLALPPGRGVLLPSLVTRSHHMHVYRRRATEIEIGSSAPSARLLYVGGTGPKGEAYPARKPWEMTSAQREQLDRAVVAHVELRIKGALARAAIKRSAS